MASSTRSTARAKSSKRTSHDRKRTSTSSPTTSASNTTEPVIIALGSNLGDRRWHLRRAIHELGGVMRLVRISSIYETSPVDAPAGSPDFLNMVVVGLSRLRPQALLAELMAIEARLGRVRQGRNAPRVIDLDLILFGARQILTQDLVVPHPRYREREFVLAPMREVWVFPYPARPGDVEPSRCSTSLATRRRDLQ